MAKKKWISTKLLAAIAAVEFVKYSQAPIENIQPDLEVDDITIKANEKLTLLFGTPTIIEHFYNDLYLIKTFAEEPQILKKYADKLISVGINACVSVLNLPHLECRISSLEDILAITLQDHSVETPIGMVASSIRMKKKSF